MIAANIKALLRRDTKRAVQLIVAENSRWAFECAAIIALGSGIYGLTVGIWRSPLQSFFTASKFPLLIFLTCAGNALLNGMLAQLFGSGLSFRQTSVAILTSFAAASCLLLAFSPIALFVWWNAPPLDASNAVVGHSVMLLMHVFLIAYAGVASNMLLLHLLRAVSPRKTATRVLFGWLGGNLLLGSQLAWILRPFIGSPGLAVNFLRPDPLHGNFYEAVGRAIKHLLF